MNTKLIFLPFILLVIHTNSFRYATAQELPPPVYDTDGDEVKPGVEYYISYPVGFRGGIGLPATANWTCPASVIEMPFETQLGLPVSFQPVDPNEHEIRSSTTELYIRFHDVKTRCPDGSAAWSVNRFGERSFVVAGTLVDNPSGHFRLARDGTWNVYKFAHCPPIAWLMCSNIGTFRLGSRTRLVVNDQGNDDTPLRVVFFKKQANGIIRQPKWK